MVTKNNDVASKCNLVFVTLRLFINAIVGNVTIYETIFQFSALSFTDIKVLSESFLGLRTSSKLENFC